MYYHMFVCGVVLFNMLFFKLLIYVLFYCFGEKKKLIFKIYLYNARKRGYLNKSHLLIYIKGIRDKEKKRCENDAKRRKRRIRNGKMFH